MYNGYNIKTKSNDSVYRIEFSKPQNITIYEFKLQKVSYSKDPVLTYSLWVNGINKRKQSTSLNAVFTNNKSHFNVRRRGACLHATPALQSTLQ